jgi:hypothetical protein
MSFAVLLDGLLVLLVLLFELVEALIDAIFEGLELVLIDCGGAKVEAETATEGQDRKPGRKDFHR